MSENFSTIASMRWRKRGPVKYWYLRLLFSDRMLELQARRLDQWRGQQLG